MQQTSSRRVFAVGLATALILGGCASVPPGQMHPTATNLSPGMINKVAKIVPTQSLAMMAMMYPNHPDTFIKLSHPAGTMNGGVAASQQDRTSAASAVTMGVGLGGPLGVALMLLGTAQTYHNNHPKAAGIRYGVLPVVSEPTLDLYRTLPPRNRTRHWDNSRPS